MNANRSFIGVGPSLEWHADTLLAGRSNTAGFTFDWGVNGALLLGRQKMRAHHETSAHYKNYRHSSGPLPVVYKTRRTALRGLVLSLCRISVASRAPRCAFPMRSSASAIVRISSGARWMAVSTRAKRKASAFTGRLPRSASGCKASHTTYYCGIGAALAPIHSQRR